MRPVLLIIALVVQVLLFRTLEGLDPSHSGGVALHYITWFLDGVAAWAPLLFAALAMCIAVAAAGVDLSFSAIAALIAAALNRFDPQRFFTVALPLSMPVALAAGGINGVLVRYLPVWPIVITALTGVLWRGVTWLILASDTSGGGGASGGFGMINDFHQLGRFEAAVGIALLAHLLVAALTWWSGGQLHRRPEAAFALVGFMSFFAALVYAAMHLQTSVWALLGLEVPALAAALLAGVHWRSGVVPVASCFLAALNVALLMRGMESIALLAGLSPRIELALEYAAPLLVIAAVLILRRMNLSRVRSADQ